MWARIATVVAGAATVVAGVVFSQPLLVSAGVAVIGWAIPHPSDRKE